MIAATTTTAIAEHAHERLSDLLAEAVRYHAAALREADRNSRPWASMIEFLYAEARGFGELALLVAVLGDAEASRRIEGDLGRAQSTLAVLAEQARCAYRAAFSSPHHP
ncbi:MAG: hypothetical protein IAE86_06900 [Burkholderiaceae bacterium]|nr:hypothetical protein [Burkholderiaceae bacterium]